jgi:pyruvate kinase
VPAQRPIRGGQLPDLGSVVCNDVTGVDDMTERAMVAAKSLDFAQSGQTLVIAAGMPFGTPGSTNLLRIAQID